jgi:hypothetical protein
MIIWVRFQKLIVNSFKQKQISFTLAVGFPRVASELLTT